MTSALCKWMHSTIASLLLLWGVAAVAQDADFEGPPAASALTIAQLSERVAAEFASLRTFESYPMPESFERLSLIHI